MDIQDIVAQLKQERGRIEAAIAALMELGFHSARQGRPPKVSLAGQASRKKRRTMSASARAKISAAQRARWAKQKGKSAAKGVKKATGRKPMNPAMKKKLSALMKARWAAKKKAGGRVL